MLDVKSIMEDSTEIVTNDGNNYLVGSKGRSSEETAEQEEEEENETHKKESSFTNYWKIRFENYAKVEEMSV